MRVGRRLGLLTIFVAGCAPATAEPPSTVAVAEDVLVAVGACIGRMDENSLYPFLYGTVVFGVASSPGDYDLDETRIACVRAAGANCIDVRACFGRQMYRDARCDDLLNGMCEGDTMVRCVFGVRTIQDCARLGRSCVGGHCVDPVCPTLPCSAPAPTTSPPCTQDTCDEDTLRLCDLEVGRVRDVIACSAYGMHCAAESAVCVSDATECAPTSPIIEQSACEGDALRYCGVDGRFHAYDCVAHGFEPCVPSDPLDDLSPPHPRCGTPENLVR